MRLYIDVDDTLIFWKETGMVSWKNDSYTVNTKLIRLIEQWSHKKMGMIVIWSGGGQQYAEYWRNKLLRHVRGIVSLPKYLTGPTEYDIVVDDMYGEIKTNGILIDPRQLDPLKDIIERYKTPL